MLDSSQMIFGETMMIGHGEVISTPITVTKAKHMRERRRNFVKSNVIGMVLVLKPLGKRNVHVQKTVRSLIIQSLTLNPIVLQ